MQNQSSEFLRYTLVGAVATAIHYALLLALVEFAGVPPPQSAAFGTAAGAFVAYGGNRYVTFPGRARHRIVMPRFAAVAVVSTGANGALVWLGSAVLGWHYLVAQAAATLLIVVLGYNLNRSWSFA